jgi:L-ascorbate metabolism protein UlaG (beta-lactamase superfamily)
MEQQGEKMNNELLYLKQNIQLEPLIDSWYAWPHLIPPGTLARNVTERHMKIMNSYINAPQIHANAVKNPKLLGGPFIDYEGKRIDEIKALRDRTKTERAHLFELSAALAELEQMLRSEARGFTLHPLYSKIPAPLKGYVELFYDLKNSPSYRLLESLLYKSRYYDRSLQSLMLSIITGDDRPFVLSTPRLESPDCFHWRIPFDDPRVDMLFDLKHNPRTWDEIREIVSLSGKDDELFKSFLTAEPPPPYKPYQGDGVRWRYFGHACILLETKSVTLLCDPVLSYTYETNISRYTYADLPDKLDYVLITHNHQDHILFETLVQLRRRIGTIIVPRNGSSGLQDPSLRLMLENVGFENVIELGDLEELEFPGGSLVALPFFGEHADLDVRTKMAYIVKVLGHSLLFAADSCNIEPKLYEHIHAEVGDVDALFLGMECDGAPLTWLYGPLMNIKVERDMDESRRLSGSNFEQAIDIVNRFNFSDVYVYAMGQEPWLNYVMSLKYTEESRPITESNRLITECRARGICAERLFGEKEILLNSKKDRTAFRAPEYSLPGNQSM